MSCIFWLPNSNGPTQDYQNHAWTPTGNPTVGRTYTMDGGKSLECDGSSYISTVSNSGDFYLGGQDFTVAGYFYLASSGMAEKRCLFEFSNSNGDALTVYSDQSGAQLVLRLRLNNSDVVLENSFTPTKDTCCRITVVYTDSTNNLALYIGGNSVYSVTVSELANVIPFTTFIFGYGNLSNGYWKGAIDEFRFYNGEALYPSATISIQRNLSDTWRRESWRYENAGYIEKTYGSGRDATSSNKADVTDPTLVKTRTGVAFRYYNNNHDYGIRMFPLPKSMYELWARVDVYIETIGNAYYFDMCYGSGSGTRCGFTCDWSSFKLRVNNAEKYSTPATTGFHQILLHIKAGEKIECWLDGNLFYAYTGSDVTKGKAIDRFGISSDDYYSVWISNIILSETSLLNDNTLVAPYQWQFIQPRLSSSTGNGTMGVDSFAASTTATNQQAWYMFEPYGYQWSASKMIIGTTVTFYTSTPIKVNHLYLWADSYYLPGAGTVAYSDDGTNFTDCGSWDDTIDGCTNYCAVATCSVPDYYNYYRLTITRGVTNYSGRTPSIYNITIDATTEIPGEYGYCDTLSRSVVSGK